MGFDIEWLAFKDMDADAVCGALKAERTGEFDESFEHGLMGALSPTGHYIIAVSGRGSHKGLVEIFPKQTDIKSEILTYTCFETINLSMLRAYSGGRMLWSITRLPDEYDGLEIEGDVPDAFAAIRSSYEAQQEQADADGEAVDYLFEAPIDFGHELTGFRHDLVQPEIRFEILNMGAHVAAKPVKAAPIKPASEPISFKPQRPWWRFW